MKIIHHDRREKIRSVKLSWDPMIVWLGATVELRIEPGDTVKEVARGIRPYIPLDSPGRYRLVGYWFAMGRRIRRGTMSEEFTRKELSSKASRRYKP